MTLEQIITIIKERKATYQGLFRKETLYALIIESILIAADSNNTLSAEEIKKIVEE